MQLFLLVSTLLTMGLQFKAEVFIYLEPQLLIQPWRILTAHWVHVGWIHCAMNLIALWCLPLIFPYLNLKVLVIATVIFPIVLSMIFYFMYPDLYAYAGFSGVLHGLYTVFALKSLEITKERVFGGIILFAVLVKLVWEASIGEHASMTSQLIGHTVFIEAHQWGVGCGVIFYLYSRKIMKVLELTK